MMGVEGSENAGITEPFKTIQETTEDTTKEINTSSTESPSPPPPSSIVAEHTPTVAALRELPVGRMNEQKQAPVKETILVKGCVPCQSKPKPKQGTYLQPSQFSFKELSASLRTESPIVEATTKSSQPRRPQHKNSRPHTLTPKSDIEDTTADTAVQNEQPSKARTTPQARSVGLGHGHSRRVDALLRKYLGDQTLGTDAAAEAEKDSTINTDTTVDGSEGTASGLPSLARSAAPVVDLAASAARRSGLKPIMRVKTEQDAAIKLLQHTPRKFHAKPVPLEVAERRLKPAAGQQSKSKNAAAAVGGEDETRPLDTFTARPVPPSTTELRYAMLVADGQIRRFSSGKSEGELQATRGGEVQGGASVSDVHIAQLKRLASARAGNLDAERAENRLDILPPVIEEEGSFGLSQGL